MMLKGPLIKYRYKIPELRLRIHSEMAVAKRPDGTWLVAATYSNAEASLVLVRPDGSHLKTIPMPEGKRGGGMVQTDENGLIYCGANTLYRVNPDTGAAEVLAADVIPNDGIWGGGVASKLVVIGSSTPITCLCSTIGGWGAWCEKFNRYTHTLFTFTGL